MKVKKLFILALCFLVISCEVARQSVPVEPSDLPTFIMRDRDKFRQPIERQSNNLDHSVFPFLSVFNPRMTRMLSKGYQVAEHPLREGVSEDGELRVYVFERDVAMVLNQKTQKLIGVYGASGNEELALIKK